jgi:3-dehydro-L-gulonate 2-dehydrogenase
MSQLRVPFVELESALHRAMLRLGLTAERAALSARLFAETTRDGVYTHGLNRFPRFAQMVAKGQIDVHGEPERIGGTAVLERWDGHRGPGNLNAYVSMQRAIALAKQNGLGAVALRNTNHWMRGGTYGWLAAEAGVFALCWTNTMPNLPPWGATTAALGNNPLILAAPRKAGPVVLDMAMSQFSYGTLAAYAKRNDPLPTPGGFDSAGSLTSDAAAIEASQRALPIGFWKGSGLSLMLDLFAAALAGGLATHQLPRDPLQESGISQVFLALDPALLADPADPADPAAQERMQEQLVDAILASVHAAAPVEPGKPARYPGEQTLQLREENLRLGVPVETDVWGRLLTDFS